jgi:hypothetical protein
VSSPSAHRSNRTHPPRPGYDRPKINNPPRHNCQASAETGQPIPRLPDNFLYVFKTGPCRARMRAATAGRAARPPLRFAALQAALGLARTRQQGAGSQTAELAINDRHPVDLDSRRNGRLPAARGWRILPSDPEIPHRPASNHGEVRSGPARVKGACGVASDRASSTLDPHRSGPGVGSYRGDAEDCPRTHRSNVLPSSFEMKYSRVRAIVVSMPSGKGPILTAHDPISSGTRVNGEPITRMM